MRFAIVIAILILLYSRASFADPADPQVNPQPASTTRPAAGREELQDALDMYGGKHGLYFTIERDERSFSPEKGYVVSPLQSHYVFPANVKSNDEFLDLLRKWVPEADVTKDEKTPDTIHIREKSLVKLDKYILDQTVSIQFKGTMNDYFSELAKRSSGALSTNVAHMANDFRDGVFSTFPASIDIKNATYREALSATEPRGNGHLLWESYVRVDKKRDDGIVTYIKLIRTSLPPSTVPAKQPATSTMPGNPRADARPVSTTQTAAGRLDLRDALQIYGAKYDLFFTIERDERSFSPDKTYVISPLQRHFVLPPDVKSKAEFLDLVREWVPEADVFVDGRSPDSIHVREKTLQKLDKYVMDQTVSIQYKGTIYDYFFELVKRSNGALSNNIGFTINDFSDGTFSSFPASIDIKDATYREALSATTPRGTSHLLWESFVRVDKKRDDGIVTYIKLINSNLLPPSTIPASQPTSSTKPSKP